MLRMTRVRILIAGILTLTASAVAVGVLNNEASAQYGFQGSCGQPVYFGGYPDHGAWVVCEANQDAMAMLTGNCGSGAFVHDTERIYGSGNVGLQIECYDYATLTSARATISPIYGGIDAPETPPEDE